MRNTAETATAFSPTRSRFRLGRASTSGGRGLDFTFTHALTSTLQSTDEVEYAEQGYSREMS